MSRINAKIYTKNVFNTPDLAKRFFNLLESLGLAPERLGTYAPLRTPYSFEKATEMWIEERDGCYVEDKGMIGKAGGMIGITKKPAFEFSTQWWRCPNQPRLNYITFSLSAKEFTKYRVALEELFVETIKSFDAVYGLMSHQDAYDRQHTTGGVETRMPGVYWCNYFGKVYVDFFGKDTISSFPWTKVENVDDRGLIFYLSDTPNDILDDHEREEQAKDHLGRESFGNKEDERLFQAQHKNVPQLF